MASRLVRGRDGKVVCPFCGREATYTVEDQETGSYGAGLQAAEPIAYGDDLVVMTENMCNHLAAGEWELFLDGGVEVVAYSEDEDE